MAKRSVAKKKMTNEEANLELSRKLKPEEIAQEFFNKLGGIPRFDENHGREWFWETRGFKAIWSPNSSGLIIDTHVRCLTTLG